MFDTSNPKHPFLVVNKIELFPEDTQILIKLYQPLIGATSISLYQTLIEDFDPYAMISDAQAIGLLQQQIDCSLLQLFDSLHKLEAVGLVKTYLSDTVVGKTILFRLLKVPQAQEFFATPLLSSLLREKIGVTNFQNISHYFAKKSRDKEKEIKDAQEVSASFFEVFRLSSKEAISPSNDVQEAAKENQVQDIPQAKINDTDNTDWDFIEDQFEVYQIPRKEIQLKKQRIRAIMQSYGLTEKEFVDESLPTLHGSYQLDMKEIERIIAENYRIDHSRKNVEKEIAKNKAKLTDSLPKTSKEQKLLEAAKKMSSAQFLYKMKEQKGGFSTAMENQILTNLHVQHGLPVEMVNIITYVCLTYYDNANVTLSLANNLANDWLQHHISTAEQALQYVQNRYSGQSSNKKKVRPTYKKHVEKGTDWSKKKAKKPSKEFNPQEMKNFFKDFEDKHGMN